MLPSIPSPLNFCRNSSLWCLVQPATSPCFRRQRCETRRLCLRFGIATVHSRIKTGGGPQSNPARARAWVVPDLRRERHRLGHLWHCTSSKLAPNSDGTFALTYPYLFLKEVR